MSSQEQWVALQSQTQHPSLTLPYKTTWALPVHEPRKFDVTIPYVHHLGSIGTARYEPVASRLQAVASDQPPAKRRVTGKQSPMLASAATVQSVSNVHIHAASQQVAESRMDPDTDMNLEAIGEAARQRALAAGENAFNAVDLDVLSLQLRIKQTWLPLPSSTQLVKSKAKDTAFCKSAGKEETMFIKGHPQLPRLASNNSGQKVPIDRRLRRLQPKRRD